LIKGKTDGVGRHGVVHAATEAAMPQGHGFDPGSAP